MKNLIMKFINSFDWWQVFLWFGLIPFVTAMAMVENSKAHTDHPNRIICATEYEEIAEPFGRALYRLYCLEGGRHAHPNERSWRDSRLRGLSLSSIDNKCKYALEHKE